MHLKESNTCALQMINTCGPSYEVFKKLTINLGRFGEGFE
jgi:hypothetical protein